MKSWIFGSPTYFSHCHSQAIPTQNLRCQVGPSGYLKYHKVAPPKMVTSPVAKKNLKMYLAPWGMRGVVSHPITELGVAGILGMPHTHPILL